MVEKTQETDRAALDNAIVQCLRLFARHGRQIRAEKVVQAKKQDTKEEKGDVVNPSSPR